MCREPIFDNPIVGQLVTASGRRIATMGSFQTERSSLGYRQGCCTSQEEPIEAVESCFNMLRQRRQAECGDNNDKGKQSVTTLFERGARDGEEGRRPPPLPTPTSSWTERLYHRGWQVGAARRNHDRVLADKIRKAA